MTPWSKMSFLPAMLLVFPAAPGTSCDPEVTQQELKKDLPQLQPEGPIKNRTPKGNIQQQ